MGVSGVTEPLGREEISDAGRASPEARPRSRRSAARRPRPAIRTRTVRTGSSGSAFSAHSIAVTPSPPRSSSRPSARICVEALGAVEIHVVQREAAGVLGDHHEGRARHGAVDAEPGREALDEARLPRPQVAAERDDRAGRRAPGDPRGERPGRLGARTRHRDGAARAAVRRPVARPGTGHARSASRTRRIAAGRRRPRLPRRGRPGPASPPRGRRPARGGTPPRAARRSGATPWARSPPAIPVSTSPVPPVAIPGLPVGFRATCPSGRRHHGPRALERHDGAALGGEAAGAPDPVGLHLRDAAAEESRRLAGVRREEAGRRGVAAERRRGPPAPSARRRPPPSDARRRAPASGRRPGSPRRARSPVRAPRRPSAPGKLADPLDRLRGERPGGRLGEGLRHRLRQRAPPRPAAASPASRTSRGPCPRAGRRDTRAPPRRSSRRSPRPRGGARSCPCGRRAGRSGSAARASAASRRPVGMPSASHARGTPRSAISTRPACAIPAGRTRPSFGSPNVTVTRGPDDRAGWGLAVGGESRGQVQRTHRRGRRR